MDICTHQLITSVSKLEVRSGGCQLVNELFHILTEPCMLVTLQIGFEILFREAFVYLCERIFFASVFVS